MREGCKRTELSDHLQQALKKNSLPTSRWQQTITFDDKIKGGNLIIHFITRSGITTWIIYF
jgi:hypothetical protein